MNDERLMNIIVSPRVSEKATIKADSENQHVFSVLKDANKLEVKKAVEKTNRNDVIIAGGVAANKFIRSKFKELEDSLGIKVYYPDLKYCGDNAAMIAFVGSMMSPNKKENNPSQVRARWPLDELKQ